MSVAEGHASRRRGRPKATSNRQVFEDLLATCERLLTEKSHHELSQKELAACAGTTEAMIQYYFGSKDGLLIALMERSVDRVYTGLCELEDEIFTLPGNPTRHLIERLNDLYRAQLATTRLWLSEQASESKVKSSYVSRLSMKTYGKIRKIMQMLVDKGGYKPRRDVNLIAFTFMSLILSPIWQESVLPARGLSEDTFTGPEWIDYLTDLIDAQLRPPRSS